jgi:hypothetical protein
MLKPKISRFAGVFGVEDLKEKISRWLGMICLGIGAGDVRGQIYNIYDEVNEEAYVRGYNQAIVDMGKQQTLPGTK